MKRAAFLALMGTICFGLNAFAYDGYIFPDSDSEYLTQADVEGMSLQEICIAKNEIYARRGRKFLSKELSEYFNNQDWYYGNIEAANFSENVFNTYEANNAYFLSKVEHQMNANGYQLDQPGYDVYEILEEYDESDDDDDYTTGNTYVDPWSVQEPIINAMTNGIVQELGPWFCLDLDADGEEETVTLYGEDDDYHDTECSYMENYSLWVDGTYYEGSGDYVDHTLYGVSMDGETIFLILEDSGPSDDPVSTFLEYKDGELNNIGEIPDWVNDLEFDIYSNEIRATEDCRVIETARMRTVWEYDEEEGLTMIPEDSYEYVSYSDTRDLRLIQSVTVYEDMDTDSDEWEMDPQRVTFTDTDGFEWVYVDGEYDGGWLYTGDMGLHEMNGYFSGLIWAD